MRRRAECAALRWGSGCVRRYSCWESSVSGNLATGRLQMADSIREEARKDDAEPCMFRFVFGPALQYVRWVATLLALRN